MSFHVLSHFLIDTNTNSNTENIPQVQIAKKSKYKNVKVARKTKRDNAANKNTQENYTRKKKSFLDKLGTIFSKAESLHTSLGENPDWIVAFKDSVYKESRHGQSAMANKYICLGEGPIFEKFIEGHLSTIVVTTLWSLVMTILAEGS